MIFSQLRIELPDKHQAHRRPLPHQLPRRKMKKIALLIFLATGANAFGQAFPKSAKSPAGLIPSGYVVIEEIKGDLNKDDQVDHVFIIKKTDKDKIINDQHRGKLDRNRRGIIVALKKPDQYELAVENRECFSSENEDGGVYFPPELSVSINKGNIHVHYAHGRYGYWTYNFRYQNSDFELIGYDSSQNSGPVVEQEVSINFSTKNMRIRKNINPNAEGGDEKFKETWKKFTLAKPIRLREITDFDNFEVESFVGLYK